MARAEGLANPKAGKIKNPRSQAGRWQLLARAIKINRIAALSSVSWGVGQVMGSHWQWLGYGSADALVREARSGLAGQVSVMARYIDKSGLSYALSQQDWTAFARTYNGPSYRKNKYDVKMASAFERFQNELKVALPELAVEGAASALRFGARGAEVKDLQKAMTVRGYVLVSDGLFGLKTDRVLRQFQRDHMLEETGIVGTKASELLFGAGTVLTQKMDQKLSTAKTQISEIAQHAKDKSNCMKKTLGSKLRKGLLFISKRFA